MEIVKQYWLNEKSAINEFEINHWRKESKTTKLLLRNFYQTKTIPNMVYHLRVNVSKDQSRYKQGSVDLADFHIYCSVFHADSRGVVCFS